MKQESVLSRLFLALVVVSVVLATAGWAQAWSLKGFPVTNNTGKTGRMYLSVQDQWGNPVAGRSGFGAYSSAASTPALRGIPAGTGYTTRAFIDTRGTGFQHANDPSFTFGPYALSGDQVQPITFSQPTPVPAQAPGRPKITPLNGAAIVEFDAPRTPDNLPIADSYNIYWSTDANPGPGNTVGGGELLNITTREPKIVVYNLTNGSTLYFAVSAVNGAGSATSQVSDAVVINPTPGPGASTVQLSVDTSSIAKTSQSALLVVLSDEAHKQLYPNYLKNPADLQSVQIAGVPAGTYKIYAILDLDGSGNLDAPANVSNISENDRLQRGIPIMVDGVSAAVNGPTLKLARRGAGVAVRTGHSRQNGYNTAGLVDNYNLSFRASQADRALANVTLNGGPQVNGPIDLALSPNHGNSGDYELQLPVQARPQVGDSYQLTLSYLDGSVEQRSAAVTGIMDAFTTPLFPVNQTGPDSVAPLFAWNNPGNLAGFLTSSVYSNGFNAEFLQMYSLTAPSQGISYPTGMSSQWSQNLQDLDGNSSYTWNSFTPNASGPRVSGFTPQNGAAGSTLTILGSGFDANPANNQVAIGGMPATVSAATTSMLTVAVPASSGIVTVNVNGITAGSSTPFAVTVPYTVTLTNGADGTSPLSGAAMTLLQNPTSNTLADTSGSATLQVPARPYFSLAFNLDSYLPTHSALTSVTGPVTTSFNLFTATELQARAVAPSAGKGVIVARVQDLSSNATTLPNVAGAVVTATSVLHPDTNYVVKYTNGSTKVALDPALAAQTASDGRFYVVDVEEGDIVTVSATKNGMWFPSRVFLTHAGTVFSGNLKGALTSTASANPKGGSYSVAQSVTLTATDNDNIFYTLDGSDPTISGMLYNGPITVNPSTTLRFVARNKYVAGAVGAVQSEYYGAASSNPPATATGTYSFDSATNTLTLNWTSTNFPCNGPVLGTETETVTTLTDTTMTWGASKPMTFTRSAGTGIVGSWSYTDSSSPAPFQLTLSGDGLVSYSGYPVCSTPGGDTQPPTVPTGVSASLTSTNLVNLFWNASSDNVGVVRYQIFRNGTLVGQPTGAANTTWQDGAVTPGSNYNYSVSACDAANNCSMSSQPAYITVPGTGTGTGQSASASGSYSYDSASRVLSLTWNSSSFPCQGPKVGTETQNVGVLSATSMTWSSQSFSWFRTSGSDGSVLGTWGANDPATGNTYSVTFNSDGTVSANGTIYSCGNATTGASTQVVNNTGNPIYQVLVGNVLFNQNITSCGSGCSTPFYPVPVGNNPVVLQQSAASANLTLGSLGYFDGTKSYAVNIVNAAAPCAELWQRADVGQTFAGDTAKVKLGSTCSGGGSTQAPATPTGLNAMPEGTSQVYLSWNYPADSSLIANYRVYRFEQLVGQPSGAENWWTDTGLTPGASYSYSVAACDANNTCSAPSLPVQVTLAPAPKPRVFPLDGAAFVTLDQNNNTAASVAPSSYDIYWSTTPYPGPSNTTGGGQLLGIPTKKPKVVVYNLTNGSTLYFAVAPSNAGTSTGNATGSVAYSDPVTINPPQSAASTVRVTVDTTGIAKNAPWTPLLVALSDDSSKAIYANYVKVPTDLQSVEIPGVASGTYKIYTVLDLDGKGNVDALANPSNTVELDRNQRPIPITVDGVSATVNGPTLKLAVKNAAVAVGTRHARQSVSATSNGTTTGTAVPASVQDSYSLLFQAARMNKELTGATVESGPQLAGAMTLYPSYDSDSPGHFQMQMQVSQRPKAGDSYRFTLNYADGSSETMNAAVTGVLDSFATPLYPVQQTGPDSLTPTFSWANPGNIASFLSSGVYLNGFNADFLTMSTLSVPYQGYQLYGSSMQWQQSVRDLDGNEAVSFAEFAPSASGPQISGFSPKGGPAGTTVTISGSGFDATPANNRVSFGGMTAQVLTASADTLTVSAPASSGIVTVAVSGISAGSKDNFAATVPFTANLTDGADGTTVLNAATFALAENPQVSTSTGTSGAYTLGVPARPYFSMVFSQQGYYPTYSSLLSLSGNNTSNYSLYNQASLTARGITLAAGKGVIMSRVQDGSSNASSPPNLAGAVVSATSLLHPDQPYVVKYTNGSTNAAQDPAAYGQTASDGRYYVVDVDEGDYVTVTAHKAGMWFQNRVFATHGGAVSSGSIKGYALTSATATPPGGVYSTAQNVTLGATANDLIYYTTDGSDPLLNGTLYTVPLTVTPPTVLKFVARNKYQGLAAGPVQTAAYSTGAQSGTASGTYTFDPASGQLVLNWTASSFSCSGPKLGQEVQTVTSLSASTMTWLDGSLSFSRSAGTPGSLLGTWNIVDQWTNSYTATFNSDNSVSVTGTVYFCDGGNTGGGSTGPDTQSPTIPGNLYAVPSGNGQFTFSWNPASDNVGVTSYNVFRNGNPAAQLPAPGTSWIDAGVTAGTVYSYSVNACDAAGNCSAQAPAIQVISFGSVGQPGTASGQYSYNPTTGVLDWTWSQVNFVCDGPKPGAEVKTISSLTATSMVWASDSTMSWTRPSGTAGSILGTWNGLDSSTGNSFQLTFNSDGTMTGTGTILFCSGYSGGTIMLPQSVTLSAPTQVLYGSQPVSVATSASSGLPVNLTVLSGPATLNGQLLSFTGAGSVVLKASQAGNSSYLAAQTQQTITVAPRPITVTADAKTKVYGSADPPLTFQVTAGSLVGTDAFNGSLVRSAGEAAGNYPIQQGNLSAGPNYQLSFQGAPLAITAKPLVITANNASRPYGAANPANPGFTAPALVAGDQIASLTYGYAASATPTADVGTTHAITPSAAVFAAGSAANYQISYQDGLLTIAGSAAQSVTFSAPSKATYGDLPITLAASASSGLPVSFTLVSGPATLNGSQLSFTGAGNVVLKASQGGNANFAAAADVQQTVAVAARPLLVNADAKAKVYGSPDPALTFQVTGGLVGSDAFTGGLTRSAGEAVGSYPILQGSLSAGPNYQITYQGAAFDVTARPLVITANNATRPYGAPNPANPGFSAPALVAGDQIAALTYNYAGSATATADVGTTHAITPSAAVFGAGSAANYQISYRSGTLTIAGKAEQSISFAPPTAKKFGDAPFTLSAQSSSGLPVSLSVLNGPATLSGNLLSISGAGSISLAANQPGDLNYNPALPVNAVINVAKADQVIVNLALQPASLNVSGTSALSATGGPSGSPVTFVSTTPAVCSVQGNMVHALAAGTCTVVASQEGNLNYNAAQPLSQSLSVGAGGQQIGTPVFNPTVVKVNGSTQVVAQGGASGNPVTFTSATPTVCSVEGNTVHGLTAGSCTVVANQAGNADYQAAPPVSAGIPVGKATQSIGTLSLAPSTLGVGGSATLTASASSSLAVGFTSTTPGVCQVSGSTLSALAAGNCSVVASQSGDANYLAAAPVTQPFTIGKGSQSIGSISLAGTLKLNGTATLVASASSGLGVSFLSTTPDVCQVSGSTLTALASGNCSVAADQVGDANFNPAPQVTQSFTVAKASQNIGTIGFAPASLAVNGTSQLFAQGGASGNPVSFTSLTGGVCQVSGSTVTALAAGSCTVAADQAGNVNYNAATQVTQVIQVAQAAQVINALGFTPNQVQVGGTTQLSATGGASGNPVSFSSLTPAVCSVSGSTLTVAAAGSCTVAADQAGNANYLAATRVTSTIVAGKAGQSISVSTPAPATAPYNGQFTVAATAPGGSVSYSSGSPAICSNTGASFTMLSGAGTCLVLFDQAGGSDFNPAPQVAASVQAVKAAQTISVTTPAPASSSFNGQFTVAASAPGGAVSYSSGSPAVCSNTGATFTMLASTGTCLVQYSQAGSANYAEASQVVSSTTLGKAAQTIGTLSFTPATLSFGTSSQASAQASSGLTVSFSSLTPTVCSVSGTQVTGLKAGTCIVAADQPGNANFQLAPQATQNITVAAQLPGAPGIGSAQAGNTQATVSFQSPASNGGSPITGYTVTAQPGDITARGAASPLTVYGLTNGTAYSFTVTASNAAGTGPASPASNAVTPGTVPNPPTAVQASAGNASAQVSFTPPVDNGGNTIVKYSVLSTPGGFTASGSQSPIIVTGLTNGTAYSFTVSATNAMGSSAPSAPSTPVKPVTVPGAPTGVAATGNNASATVRFLAPADNGGTPVTGFTVTSNPGGVTASGTQSPIAVSGLTNGTSYSFTVTALNLAGSGSASAPSNAVAPSANVPGPPAITQVSGANGSVTVSFSVPVSDGGSPISGYTVTSAPGNLSASGSASPITVTGLMNGTSYNFTVTASNVAGTGVPSAPSAAVVPATVPDPVTAVTASGGNGSATVSFQPPAFSGGSPVTGYLVTASPGNITREGTASPIVVTGLTNGTSYSFTVIARNLKGDAPASPASNSVTPDLAPGVPGAVQAVAGNGSATVSFQAPVANGGSAIAGYTVTSTPGGLTASGAQSPITVSGLANGTAYSFTVTANNATRSGAPSAPSNSVTPATVPGAPVDVVAQGGNGSATVSFAIPASNGGSAITGYTVTATPGGVTASGTQSPIVVTGLINGTAYSFTVTAANAKGTGSASAPSNSVTPLANVPGAPVIGVASAGAGEATVSFTPPVNDGGSAILDYTVTSAPGNLTATGSASPITVSGLTNGVRYSFTVSARNVSGPGAASAASNGVVPDLVPAAPAMGSASADYGIATVSFSAPASNGGTPVLGYTVTSTPGGLSASGTQSPITVRGLTNGTTYSFTVQAVNAKGAGAPSAASNTVTPADATAPAVYLLGIPGALQAADSASTVSVPVLAILAHDNVGITGYQVSTSSAKPAAGAAGWTPTAPASLDIPATPGIHQLYAFAKDAAGNVSDAAGAQVILVPVDTTPPVIISGPTVTLIRDSFAVIEWQTSESATGALSFGQSFPLTGTQTEGNYGINHSLTVSGLTADTTYFASVTATDLSGNGPSLSREISFRTSPAPDTQPPLVTEGPALIGIGPDSATVVWRTNEPAQGSVYYGTATTLGSTQPESGFVTGHSLKLSGLEPQTVYYLKVSASDVLGNGPRESALVSFKTTAAPDLTAPVVVEGPMVVNISDSGATVIWKTNEPSTSEVTTDTGGTNYALVADDTLTTSHTVNLTGLEATTPYNYRIASSDGFGNTMRQGNAKSFSTLAAPDLTPPVILEGPMALNITEQSALISWGTDEPSDGVVEYGTSEALEQVASRTQLVRGHAIGLTGLNAGTLYYYRVSSTDSFGNGPTQSRVGSFTTNAFPVFKQPVITKAPSVIYRTDTTLTLYWETDEPCDSVVQYGENDTLTEQVAIPDLVTRHQVTITNLKLNTAYKVVVSSTNASGRTVTADSGERRAYYALNLVGILSDALVNVSSSDTTTLSQADVTAPAITAGPAVSGISDTQAVITWTTDEISDSQVSYGASGGALGFSTGSIEQTRNHVVVLTNLAANTAYDLKVGSTDPSGNGPTLAPAGGGVVTFTTAATPDLTAPVISSITTPALTASQVTVEWTTDEPATTQVKYGLSPSALNGQAAGNGLSTDHSLTLALQSGTTYFLSVVAADAAGNTRESAPISFTMLGEADTTEPSTTPSLGSGSYQGAQDVALTADKPANIYYTTDGSDPTVASPIYNSPIRVATSKRLAYFAIDGSGNQEVAKTTLLIIQYPISTATPDGNGSLSCPALANSGEAAVCSATPSTGYQTASVTGCGTGNLVGDSYTTGLIAADCTVTATFALKSYLVTPATGTGWNIVPATGQSVNHGSNTSFTVTPQPGYGILEVTGCGGTLTGTSYQTGAVTAACAVTVNAVKHSGGGVNGQPPTVSDAYKALQSLSGRVQLTAQEQIELDVAPLASNGTPTGDGKVDGIDVIHILRRSIGIGTW
ncbi:hypothetical protein GMLC_12920 [Geomonas limicola]|uniref:Fibronectin type-III domain-containing protein n=1 Tax=Geomonas limicola TaxID=2740186 RepID=A0A6V8N839_9BACT|nr:fibronectin type III domain-containing protein [Geomonas limicola]GFO67713.1 hypothetical protein GMLC_12920 [Geomonas limicola]